MARSLRDRECGWKNGGACYSDSLRTGMENRGKRWNLEEWNRVECESRRDAPTWLGLSETENADGRTGGRAIRAVSEPEWKTVANGGTWRNGTGRMRASERLAHVARSLRDREWGWKDGGACYSERSPNRNGKPWQTVELGGMERPECESRRDTPTWLGLSETEKADGRTKGPLLFRQSSNRNGKSWHTAELGGMERSECKSRQRLAHVATPSQSRSGRP